MRKITLLIILCFIFGSQSVYASDSSFYKAVANFIYNFPKIIKSHTGNVCVYGYDQVTIAIEEKYKNNVFYFRSEKDLEGLVSNKCVLLYISKAQDKTIGKAIQAADKAKIISIGLEDHFIEDGGTILIQMGRRNFELMMNHPKVKLYETQFDPIISNLLIN